MKTTLSMVLVATRLLFACDPPSHESSKDAGADARVIDAGADASASNTDAATDAMSTADAATDGATTTDAASASDAGRDAAEPPIVTCPMARQVPFPEVCNAFDDDCDGRMDEGTCDDPCDQPW